MVFKKKLDKLVEEEDYIFNLYINKIDKALDERKILSGLHEDIDIVLPALQKKYNSVKKILINEEKIKNELDKIIDKISIRDSNRLNDKNSFFREDIPYYLQTDKEITIEEYQKHGDECFYKQEYLDLEELVYNKLTVAYDDYKIISFEKSYHSFPIQMIYKMKKKIHNKRINKIINEMSERDLEKLNDKESSHRKDIPYYLQTDKKITIEEYRKNGERCFYNQEYLNYKKLFRDKFRIASNDFKVISYPEAYICFRDSEYFQNGKENFVEEIDKIIEKVSESDLNKLNDKESSHRKDIPLELQTNKKITIEDYRKRGKRCFYKNMEDNLEV